MSLLNVSRLKKSFGEELLFDGVSFEIGEGEHIGLVGGEWQRQNLPFSNFDWKYAPGRGGNLSKQGNRDRLYGAACLP